MMNLRLHNDRPTVWKQLAVLAALAFCSTVAFGGNSITGAVRNATRGEPASGYEVVLLRLDKGMQEEARAKTDARGAFTLDVHYPNQSYLVRVIHQGVAYDQRTVANDALAIQVFDAAPQVPGVKGTIEILRTGTKGNLLHVSDMVEIKNESSPPLTQASARTFDAYLPPNAKMDSVLAAAPGKIAVVISAAHVPNEPGHYTVDFPLRPGATKFAFNYDVPYSGHAIFQTRHRYPLQQFAVMIPRSMKFSSPSPAFKVLATGGAEYQVRAITQAEAGEGPSFEVSGVGPLPSIQQQAKTQHARADVPGPITSTQLRTPSRLLQQVVSRSERLRASSQSRVLVVLTAILLGVCAFLIRRTRKESGGQIRH